MLTKCAVSSGYYSVGGDASTRTQQVQCEAPGNNSGTSVYCSNGMRYVCPGGFFGNSSGLNTSVCTGGCSAGYYYCPAGSTNLNATAIRCGGTDKYVPRPSPNDTHSLHLLPSLCWFRITFSGESEC